MKKAVSNHFALVLPGAVARGAYEAGVIEVLAEQNIPVDRVVATSSGALNGLAYAVGIRCGKEKEMARKLTQSWIENGSWHNIFDFDLWTLIRGRGFSRQDGLISLMRELITPCGDSKASNKREVEFRVIVTPLDGVISNIGKNPATTYEQVIEFSGKDFDTAESLEKVFKVVAAASAFPGMFSPVELPGLGSCVDGGSVNNAPIGYALQDSGVNRVIVPVPFPAIMKAGSWRNHMGFLGHLIEILINERLFRDLKMAHAVNVKADRLAAMKAEGFISDKQLEKIKADLCIRKVEVTEVRPDHGLKSGPFSGFFQRQDRVRLVEQGRKAAKEALAKVPEMNPTGEKKISRKAPRTAVRVS